MENLPYSVIIGIIYAWYENEFYY